MGVVKGLDGKGVESHVVAYDSEIGEQEYIAGISWFESERIGQSLLRFTPFPFCACSVGLVDFFEVWSVVGSCSREPFGRCLFSLFPSCRVNCDGGDEGYNRGEEDSYLIIHFSFRRVCCGSRAEICRSDV